MVQKLVSPIPYKQPCRVFIPHRTLTWKGFICLCYQLKAESWRTGGDIILPILIDHMQHQILNSTKELELSKAILLNLLAKNCMLMFPVNSEQVD